MSGALTQLKSSSTASWIPPAPRYETLRKQLGEIQGEAKREYGKAAQAIDAIQSDAFARKAPTDYSYTTYANDAMARAGTIEAMRTNEDDIRGATLKRELKLHFNTVFN